MSKERYCTDNALLEDAAFLATQGSLIGIGVYDWPELMTCDSRCIHSHPFHLVDATCVNTRQSTSCQWLCRQRSAPSSRGANTARPCLVLCYKFTPPTLETTCCRTSAGMSASEAKNLTKQPGCGRASALPLCMPTRPRSVGC